MIIVLKANRSKEQVKNFISNLTDRYDVSVNTWVGTHSTVLGLIGDTAAVDSEYIAAQDIVESVKRVQEPYKKANRKFHPEDTVIKLPTGQVIGDGSLALIAGPCSVESEAQICCVAERVKAAGATFLRGGAFKPRTSPYAFQGLKAEGLELLKKAKERTGLPIVTEIMSIGHLDLFEDVDVIQVGARNMQNFDLLKAVGRLNVPVLLKRGMSLICQVVVAPGLPCRSFPLIGYHESLFLQPMQYGIFNYGLKQQGQDEKLSGINILHYFYLTVEFICKTKLLNIQICHLIFLLTK